MKHAVQNEYLEKAKNLTRDEAEQVLSRMKRKLMRQIEDQERTPLEAVARQLQKEDEDLQEWRLRWSEIQERENKKKK
ncbi:MAG TPA: hypothetical protein VGK09_12580 [Rhodocyclaceae bacterium]